MTRRQLCGLTRRQGRRPGSGPKWQRFRGNPNNGSDLSRFRFQGKTKTGNWQKDRAIILGLTVLVVSLTILTISFIASPWALPVLAGNQGEWAYTYKEIVIEPGDTLWKLASTYGRPDLDPRRIIWEIQQFNHLRDSSLHAGQVLRLPKEVLK